MARHYNPSIVERVVRQLNTKTGDHVGQEINDNISMIIPVMPRIDIVKTSAANNSTSATVYTVPSDKDFYLMTAVLHHIRDATATSVESSIRITVDGVVQKVCVLSHVTLTAGRDSVALAFPIPVKIDRNTTITVNNSTATGNVISTASITGYTEEVVKGT